MPINKLNFQFKIIKLCRQTFTKYFNPIRRPINVVHHTRSQDIRVHHKNGLIWISGITRQRGEGGRRRSGRVIGI